MSNSVAVIGAGTAGLAAIKCALEVGLKPTAFEQESWFGGIWRYTEDVTKPCVAHSTITNLSKHSMCFSDFPMPKEFPNFLPHQQLQKYFEMYASHFDLVDKIRFGTAVTAVTPCADHDLTGKWNVHYHSLSDNGAQESVVETFNFVMVCTGYFSVPVMPEIPGLDRFEGDVIHSKSYKTWKPFKGKRVLVIGLGNSAADIACELSRHASQVYLSTRSGAWVLSRLTDGGIPFDTAFLVRAKKLLPSSLSVPLLVQKLQTIFNPANFGLQPKDLPHRQFLLINDELPYRIITGSLIVKSDIASIEGRSVMFTDSSRLDDIDKIILATGFKTVFPLIDESLLHPGEHFTPLYKYVFPPAIKKGTLAIIGAVRVTGPVPAIVEMQARWATHVFTGNCSLPDPDIMMEDILKVQEDHTKQCGNISRGYNVIRNFIAYMDEIGTFIGVIPSFWKLWRQDPSLAWKCFFGPCVPAQYRLFGPGAWQGARAVIDGVQESMLLPLRTRVGKKYQSNGHLSVVLLFAALVIVFGAVLLYYVTL